MGKMMNLVKVERVKIKDVVQNEKKTNGNCTKLEKARVQEFEHEWCTDDGGIDNQIKMDDAI